MAKRIFFISTNDSFPWGGSEELWAKTALQAIQEGNEVAVSVLEWSLSHPRIQVLIEHGAKVILRKKVVSSHLLPLYKKIISRVKTKVWNVNQFFLQDIQAYNPDLIVINQGHIFDLLGHSLIQSILKSVHKPFFLINQLCPENYILKEEEFLKARNFFNKANKIFFVSWRNLQTAKRVLASDLPNACVIFNPINLNDTTSVNYPNIDGTVSFASVARLDVYWKGQDTLLEALGGIEWKERNWILNFYGKGPDENYLRQLAAYFGIEKKVIFHGHVSDIREVWKKNHVHILPSIGEGTPLALVESMMCGRPAIVTDVGGNTELIQDGLTGFVAEAPSPKYIGQALEKAWKNKELWFDMGEKAHQKMVSSIDFTPERTLLSLILSSKIELSNSLINVT